MVVSTLMTIEEFKRLPEDGMRHELIRGVLYRMPPPKPRHGRVTGNAFAEVRHHVRANGLGAVYDQSGIMLPGEPDTMVGPDVAFVQQARLPIDEGDYPVLAPDLVIEVASPSDSGPTIEDKIKLYLAAGVRLVWAIDPGKRTVRIRKPDGTDRLLTEHDTLDGEDVLPGSWLPVATLFE